MTRSVFASACVLLLSISCSAKDSSPTAPTTTTPPPTTTPPTPTPTPSVPTVASVSVSGPTTFVAAGQSQLTAMVTLSNGATEDRTGTASWQSSNTTVATVSSQGLVRVLASGDASIMATVSDVRGSLGISVRIPNRTPDPQAGQRLPLPDIRAFLQQAAAARPELVAQSCPTGFKYQNNPWLDYMVDQLRTLDTRWGYNGKPTRTAGDNGGQPVIAAGDEVAYHYGAGPDQDSRDVYLIDILEGHCGPSPRLTYRDSPARNLASGRVLADCASKADQSAWQRFRSSASVSVAWPTR
jgi:hypothetical protein